MATVQCHAIYLFSLFDYFPCRNFLDEFWRDLLSGREMAGSLFWKTNRYYITMSIDLTEATRLARICLPQILADSETAGEAVDDATATTPLLTDEHVSVKTLCRLWAGMGYIYQVTIAIPSSSSSSSLSLALNNNKHIKSNNIAYHHFIIKQIVIPPPTPHSRRSVGNERKAYSYFIEAKFYQSLAPILIKNHNLAIPIPYHIELGGCSDDAEKGYGNLSDNSRVTVEEKDQIISICMSLLNGSPSSNRDGTNNNIHAALSWLATLHAATWGAAKVDAYVGQKLVHPIGSYWHLDTRPDEHESMPNQGWEGRLKRAARAINERLRRDTMQCCIHGDAKDANMLFQKMDDDDDGGGSGVSVSMFDFQYCGKAPPSVSASAASIICTFIPHFVLCGCLID